jgi:hypothetical protein
MMSLRISGGIRSIATKLDDVFVDLEVPSDRKTGHCANYGPSWEHQWKGAVLGAKSAPGLIRRICSVAVRLSTYMLAPGPLREGTLARVQFHST